MSGVAMSDSESPSPPAASPSGSSLAHSLGFQFTQPSASHSLTVNLTIDFCCSWCYVIFRRLEKAFTHLPPSVPISIQFQPFELDPLLPTQGMDKIDYYHQKFGPARTEQSNAQMVAVCASEGIHFRFGGLIARTLNAHRLMHFAQQYQRTNPSTAANEANGGWQYALSTRLARELFTAYFERNENLGDLNVLLNTARTVGLPVEETKRFLESQEAVRDIEDSIARLRENEVHGVPHCTFNGQYATSGAQELSTILNIFNKLGLITQQQANVNGSMQQ